MTRLVLVRHAEVALDAARRAPGWHLTEAGREASDALATSRSWAGVAVVAASTEPKARDTAAPIAAATGLPVRVEHDLREVDRGALPVLGREKYEELVRRYLAGETVESWEPARAARERFEHCLERLLGETKGDILAVTHGLVISLFLGLSFEQWAALPLPAVLEAP